MITIAKAKNILGKETENMSDEEIQKELDMAVFLSEILLDAFKQKNLYVKVKKELNYE